jgi:hypothetical protein
VADDNKRNKVPDSHLKGMNRPKSAMMGGKESGIE